MLFRKKEEKTIRVPENSVTPQDQQLIGCERLKELLEKTLILLRSKLMCVSILDLKKNYRKHFNNITYYIQNFYVLNDKIKNTLFYYKKESIFFTAIYSLEKGVLFYASDKAHELEDEIFRDILDILYHNVLEEEEFFELVKTLNKKS